MSKYTALAATAVAVALLTGISAAAQRVASPTLTEKDRAEIRALAASYGRALGFCEAEDYAGLWVSTDGYFASGPRGKVVGREKLMALVRSERHCNDGSEKRVRNVPSEVVIEPAPGGAAGRAPVGNAGHYEDFYVKTAQGWRFGGRTFVSAQEEAAKLTAADFDEIRHLAGNDTGQFDDVYSTGPQGRLFRSAGVVIAPTPEGATGRAYLKKDGGRYDDVYEKTPQGWRFKSRQYAAADDSAGRPAAQAATAPNR